VAMRQLRFYGWIAENYKLNKVRVVLSGAGVSKSQLLRSRRTPTVENEVSDRMPAENYYSSPAVRAVSSNLHPCHHDMKPAFLLHLLLQLVKKPAFELRDLSAP
jgi:hypothetical protein